MSGPKASIYPPGVELPPQPDYKLCKVCFEKYQRHEPVIHYNCYSILYEGGGKDVKYQDPRTRP